MFISWQPPELNTIHGEFEGYKISYRPRDVAQAKAIEIPIESPKAKVNITLLNRHVVYIHFRDSEIDERSLYKLSLAVVSNLKLCIAHLSEYLSILYPK